MNGAAPDRWHALLFRALLNQAPIKRRLGYPFQEIDCLHTQVLKPIYAVAVDAASSGLYKAIRLLNVKRFDRRPISLSGGEKHHVSIGRALLTSSQLLLMDEPLASLDSARKDEILHFIKELSEELELPIIYASHAIDEIERLANRLALVSNGKIAAFGSVEELTVYLGLRLMTGRYEAGSAINVKIAGHAHEDGLSRLTFNGGEFAIPQISLPVGKKLRVRIRARNVAIAETEPKNIIINNAFRGNIKKISNEFSALLDVLFDAAPGPAHDLQWLA